MGGVQKYLSRSSSGNSKKLSPSSPSVFFLGERFVELLNLTFPNPPFPPFAITIFCPDFVRSSIKVLLSSSKICVPTGTFNIKSFPLFPVFFFPFPSCSFSALKCC